MASTSCGSRVVPGRTNTAWRDGKRAPAVNDGGKRKGRRRPAPFHLENLKQTLELKRSDLVTVLIPFSALVTDEVLEHVLA